MWGHRMIETTEERFKRIAARVKARIELLEQDICPTCKQPIEKYLQVRQCVYGLPCWHRLFVGTAPKKG